MEEKKVIQNINFPEKAIIVVVQTKNTNPQEISQEVDELSFLTYSAGVEVVGQVIQKREKIDPAYYIGRGKAKYIKQLKDELNANVIIFDDDLSPRQQANLEKEIETKVIDRTQLILDIFAQRAKTSEAKYQVELAQLSYLLPRLKGMGILLSRLGGGIGTRGPGETKLETDRRHIRDRISTLKKIIKDIKKHRDLHREKRAQKFKLCCLVGYTNAGKSTLLNTLCGANVYAEDKLFATLSPTTRALQLPGGEKVLLTDTVGFIKKIPHHLIASFRATLEEATESDLLLNVIDASSPNISSQISVVYSILEELKIQDKLQISVLNKIDKVEDKIFIRHLSSSLPNCVLVSAKTGEGIDNLLNKIEEILFGKSVQIKCIIPKDKEKLLSFIYENSKVISSVYKDNQVIIVAKIGEKLLNSLKPYIVNMEY